MHHSPAASRSIKLMQRDKERERKQKAGANTEPGVFYYLQSVKSLIPAANEQLSRYSTKSHGARIWKITPAHWPQNQTSLTRDAPSLSPILSAHRPTLFILLSLSRGSKMFTTHAMWGFARCSLSLARALSRGCELYIFHHTDDHTFPHSVILC